MTHDQLENYINNFQPQQRETVAKQIIDSELLAKALETSEGKAILNNAVDLIATNVMTIIRDCEKTGDANSDVFAAAREINTTYKLMTDWAKILIRGSEHRQKAEK